MDALKTNEMPNRYISMSESDFDKLINKYDLPKLIDDSLNEYTLYNGFVIKLSYTFNLPDF